MDCEKHIVITLGDYYPTPSANGICIDSIVEELLSDGFYVDLICNKNNKKLKTLKMGNKTIYFIDIPLFQKIQNCINSQNKIQTVISLIIIKTFAMFRVPFIYLAFPITSVSKCLKYKKKVDEIIKRRNVVAVIGLHKPIEAIYGAMLSANKAKIPFFPYFLDPIVKGYNSNRIISDTHLNKKVLRYESNIIEKSYKAIFMDSHKSEVCQRYDNQIREKIVFLGPPLLKKHNNSIKTQLNEKKIVIYAGSVYQDIRNPQYIIDVFKYVKNAKLEMYISCPCDWLKNINNNVTIHKGISHEEVISRMMESDAVLNIGNSSPVFIPSKVIEYISIMKPIICTYRIDDDPSLFYMNKYPLSICLDERIESVISAAKKIDSFIETKHKNISFEQIQTLFMYNTPKSFIDVIQSCLKI